MYMIIININENSDNCEFTYVLYNFFIYKYVFQKLFSL